MTAGDRAARGAREAAIRASDIAFRRLHGIRVLNVEERENAELEDDDPEDETEERTPGEAPGEAPGRIPAARRVLAPAGR